MKYFADTIIKPYIVESGYRRLCEIGASYGENTDKLIEVDSVSVTIIDPCLDTRLQEKYRGDARVQVYQGLSLDVLPKLAEPFDCIFIDGDHNWYTVYHELKLIEDGGLLKKGGTIFLHDVCWPYGRRDMYYQPETVPERYRQPYEQKGIVRGRSELSEDSPVNAEHYNATSEGGPRNGVLTAVEDFLKEHSGDYLFFHVEEEFGLGVLHKKKSALGSASFNKRLLRTKYNRARAKLSGIKGKALGRRTGG